MQFELIKNITLKEQSWKNKIFLTFDMDWCSDEVLSYTVDLLEAFDVPATFFVTHETFLLDRLRENKKFDLGIHPNFNPLLHERNIQNINAEDTVMANMSIVPEAKAVRAHSLVQSSKILDIYKKIGLEYDLSTYLPWHTFNMINPVEHINGLIRLFHFWEDDIELMNNNMYSSIPISGYLQIYDFHPIHIYLNSCNLEAYQKAKNNPQKIENYINNLTQGVRDYLVDLIKKYGK